MKSTASQSSLAAHLSRGNIGDQMLTSGFGHYWQRVTLGTSMAAFRPTAKTAKAVSLNRKLTIFYPIGWLAILGVAAWFAYLTVV